MTPQPWYDAARAVLRREQNTPEPGSVFICPHGNGLTCHDCDMEAEADDATWD